MSNDVEKRWSVIIQDLDRLIYEFGFDWFTSEEVDVILNTLRDNIPFSLGEEDA